MFKGYKGESIYSEKNMGLLTSASLQRLKLSHSTCDFILTFKFV